jgi:hypothetical protein
MRGAQEAKFDLEECKHVLVSTGNAPLVYRSDTGECTILSIIIYIVLIITFR